MNPFDRGTNRRSHHEPDASFAYESIRLDGQLHDVAICRAIDELHLSFGQNGLLHDLHKLCLSGVSGPCHRIKIYSPLYPLGFCLLLLWQFSFAVNLPSVRKLMMMPRSLSALIALCFIMLMTALVTVTTAEWNHWFPNAARIRPLVPLTVVIVIFARSWW